MDYKKEFEKYATKHKGINSLHFNDLNQLMQIIFHQLLLKKDR